MEAAGFNKLSKSTPFSGLVGTAGLGNCIAVVGFNTSNETMAIAHYDTLNCVTAHEASWSWNEASLTKFRDWFVSETRATQFVVGLGLVWFNTAEASGKKNPQGYPLTDVRRFELIRLIIKVFNHEPTKAGACFTCTVVKGAIILSAYPGQEIMPVGWAHMGLDIPYDELRVE
ncbi:hypothetical protein [Pseudomonas fontis]|uniref:Uncharacterized protein n=1 Tax=Pseudomonas fontis TaxID=2942633 RepID=A0ABT5NM91_9PSED|nr:hypothetical protein [Pseudomonas fontis]MDD0976202.1 hypothetical protein [Pseudomonas fontis]MDD0989035.1 hypothetical protein [Pseudomonas fontis]